MRIPTAHPFRPDAIRRIADVAVLASLLLAGCQSTPTSRIQQNAELFQSLDEFSQRLIRDGLVNHGFSSDLVYLALGKPNRVEVMPTVNGVLETWTYRNFLYATPSAVKLGFSTPGVRQPGSPMLSPSGSDGRGSSTTGTGPLHPALSDGSEMPIGTLVLELLEGVVVAIRIDA